MNAWFEQLGAWIARHPMRVIALWLLVIVAGGWAARQLPSAVVGGSGALAGSPSQRVDDMLRREFDNPLVQPLIVAISSDRYHVGDAAYRAWIDAAAAQLRALPEIRQVVSYNETGEAQLRSPDGHQTVLLAGLKARGVEEQERLVPVVRRALVDTKAAVLAADPQARFAVAGQAAATRDINDANQHEGDRAEGRALALSLAILVLAFGALAAAGIPLLMGLASTTVALGLAYGLAQVIPVSNLLQNVVTMIGLALGIDYSLLVVTRFRELLPGQPTAEAVAAVVGETGTTVACSGLTVVIGMVGLLYSPLLETRSIGVGGALVVLVSVLAAATLLPALLALLGPRIDAPRVLASHLGHASADAAWRRLAGGIVRRPLLTLAAAAILVGVLALPGLYARSGFDNDSRSFPAQMESRIGGEILTHMGNANLGLPIYLVLRSADGLPALDVSHMAGLVAFAARLERDPRIAAVSSPVTLHPSIGLEGYIRLYRDPDTALTRYPQVKELWLSRDRRAVLFQVTAHSRLDLAAVQALARDLARSGPGTPFILDAGGPAVYYNDYADLMWASFPAVAGFVVTATLLLLFVAFRSWLLPFKAVAMNLLAVAAGFGAVVAVFQFGWLKSWVGLEHSFAAVPLTVPLMVFCLSFGLSMDYEVFLLSRIQRRFEETADNDEATAYGLARTGPVITGAALIMVVVFGAFIGADMALLKMIGLGLAATVLVDATLIRVLMVPAVMTLAGRWNWYPGSRPSPCATLRPSDPQIGESHESRSTE